MAGIESPDGVCPVGARTGRQQPPRSHPPRRPDAAVTPTGDLPRLSCDPRLRRTKRRIASGPDSPRSRASCHVTGPKPFRSATRAGRRTRCRYTIFV